MMILTFANTRSVIQAERELKGEKIPYQVIPTPRHISSECGMCLKIPREEIQKARELLSNKKISVVKIYES